MKAVIDKNSGRELSAFLGKTQAGHDAVGKKVFEASTNQKITIIPKVELEKWKKATDSLDDAWVAEMSGKGMDGKGMLQSATDLIKQYTK